MKFAMTTGFAAVLGISMISSAAIVGPYAVDSDTLHLWHFDKDATATPSNSFDEVSPGGVNVSNQNGATWGNSAFAGFGKAGNTAVDKSIIRSAASTANVLTAPAGTDGAFTYEAMVNLSTTSNGHHIFSMDNNLSSLSARPFFFRIIHGDISLQNIGNGNVDNRVAIPTTGPDAFVANEWFHVAVTYDGNDDVADNLKFYWTRVDESRTEANLIGTGTGRDMSTTATAVYGIGNAYRTVGSNPLTQNLEGSIDEVRISGVARGADEFIFAVPEPASFATGLVGMTLLAGRRRR